MTAASRPSLSFSPHGFWWVESESEKTIDGLYLCSTPIVFLCYKQPASVKQGAKCTFPKCLQWFCVCMSAALSARRFQMLLQSILLKSCNTDTAVPVLPMRKSKLGDSKLLVQNHRAYEWQSCEYRTLGSSRDITRPLLSCSQGSSSGGSTIVCSHLHVSFSGAS